MTEEQLEASFPNIIGRFAQAIKVTGRRLSFLFLQEHLKHSVLWSDKRRVIKSLNMINCFRNYTN